MKSVIQVPRDPAGHVHLVVIAQGDTVSNAPKHETEDRQMTDRTSETTEELSFEIREMLDMLGRLNGVSDLADGASNDFGDDIDLAAFAL